MTSLRRFAIAAVLILIAAQLRADVLATIQSTCNTLGATQYEIAFVTSGSTTAVSTNIADYNNFVSAQALSGSSYLSDFVPAGTTWNAIASTSASYAITNAPTYANVPIFDTLGDLIATGSSQLWASPTVELNAPIEYTQTGNLFDGGVWTGTNTSGTPFDYSGGTLFCLGSFPNLPLPTPFGTEDLYVSPLVGVSSLTGDGWIAGSYGGFDTLAEAEALENPMYALSSPIAVPEPAALALMGVALLGLGAFPSVRRRRRATG